MISLLNMCHWLVQTPSLNIQIFQMMKAICNINIIVLLLLFKITIAIVLTFFINNVILL